MLGEEKVTAQDCVGSRRYKQWSRPCQQGGRVLERVCSMQYLKQAGEVDDLDVSCFISLDFRSHRTGLAPALW